MKARIRKTTNHTRKLHIADHELADEIIGCMGEGYIRGKVVIDFDPEGPRVLAQRYLDHGAQHVVALDSTDIYAAEGEVRPPHHTSHERAREARRSWGSAHTQTDSQTDRQTDGQTDRLLTYRHARARVCTHTDREREAGGRGGDTEIQTPSKRQRQRQGERKSRREITLCVWWWWWWWWCVCVCVYI